MKSIVLLFWVMAANGGEDVQHGRYFDDMASCTVAAREIVGEYSARGAEARYRCHPVVPEVSNVDADGNPIEVRLVGR